MAVTADLRCAEPITKLIVSKDSSKVPDSEVISKLMHVVIGNSDRFCTATTFKKKMSCTRSTRGPWQKLEKFDVRLRPLLRSFAHPPMPHAQTSPCRARARLAESMGVAVAFTVMNTATTRSIEEIAAANGSGGHGWFQLLLVSVSTSLLLSLN